MEFKQRLPIQEGGDEIKMPSINYHETVTIEPDKVFTGKVLPIPMCLINFLSPLELGVFISIFKKIRETGICIAKMDSLASELGLSRPTITYACERMKSLGILEYQKHTSWYKRIINFSVVQELSLILKNKNHLAPAALREKIGETHISKISNETLEWLNDNYGLNR